MCLVSGKIVLETLIFSVQNCHYKHCGFFFVLNLEITNLSFGWTSGNICTVLFGKVKTTLAVSKAVLNLQWTIFLSLKIKLRVYKRENDVLKARH